MQITLKQRDIEQALKLFVVSQGISLANKTVQMAFTAGRKEGGLTVEIDLEESDESQAEAVATLDATVEKSTPYKDMPKAAVVTSATEVLDTPVSVSPDIKETVAKLIETSEVVVPSGKADLAPEVEDPPFEVDAPDPAPEPEQPPVTATSKPFSLFS